MRNLSHLQIGIAANFRLLYSPKQELIKRNSMFHFFQHYSPDCSQLPSAHNLHLCWGNWQSFFQDLRSHFSCGTCENIYRTFKSNVNASTTNPRNDWKKKHHQQKFESLLFTPNTPTCTWNDSILSHERDNLLYLGLM